MNSSTKKMGEQIVLVFQGRFDFLFVKHRELQDVAEGEKIPAYTVGLDIVAFLSDGH